MRNKPLFKSSLLLLTSILAFLQPLVSAPVDTADARKAATRFYNMRTGRTAAGNAKLVYTRQTAPERTNMQTSPVNALYVFNFDHGFVMVAADTRVRPVLAYSTESTFRPENLPPQLQQLLDDYAAEIEMATLTTTGTQHSDTESEWGRLRSGDLRSTTATAVVPPLIQTSWNQNSPYNLFCPADANGPGGHAYAGCVSTTLAQLLRYWRFPANGVGSHSYNANFANQGYSNYGTLSADFSTGNYNYSLMPNSLTNASQSEINEVAKLIYHCGVAAEMMYGPYGSGAYDNKALAALQDHFGYTGAQLVRKLNYTSAAWTNLIKGELDNLRPVYYSGNGSSGGHAFICDGYDSEDYFHFNWGWSGNYNGYYTLSGLTPGNYDFSNNQIAIIGIDASQPKIHPNVRSLSFLTEAGSVSAPKTISVLATLLQEPITVTVSGDFKISTDGQLFTTSLLMGNTGGTLFVRHEPTTSESTDFGVLRFVSGATTDSVSLTGNIYSLHDLCLPPEHLHVSSQDLQHITLSWEEPVIASDPQTLSWCTGALESRFGYSSNYQAVMAQRFADTDLLNLHLRTLTAIEFYADADATVFKAVVYQGGQYNGSSFDPGVLVLSQDIDRNTLTLNGWNRVELTSPVTVDAAQELWIGIYVEASGGTYCLPLSPGTAPGKGSIVGLYSNNSISWSERYNNRSFCVRGVVENTQSVTDYQILRDETIIGSTTAVSFEDIVNSTDTYRYTVTANWSNGCSASAEQTFTNIAQISCVPQAVDFYTKQGHNNLTQKVFVSGNGLSEDIQADATGNFLISTDSVSFTHSATLPSMGGILFVRYTPASNAAPFETGQIVLQSGGIGASIPLSGQSSKGCNPPRDLEISLSGNMVDLTWKAPDIPVVQQDELTWMTALNNYSTGYSGNMSLFIAQRFDTADLTPHHGRRLKKISFIPNAAVTSYRVVVFKGGHAVNNYSFTSGTQIVDQTVNISTLEMGIWNTIELDTPVTIDAGQELWFGIYLEAPSGSYPIRYATPAVSKKGCLVKSATSTYWTEYSTNYSFALKATIEDAPISLTHYETDRNGVLAGQTSGTSYTDQLIYNGDYRYDVWAVWSDGCRAAARGMVTASELCDPQGQTFNAESCDSYSWKGVIYTKSGTYIHEYTLPDGCPAVDTLHLTVNAADHTDLVETVCGSYTWHGTTYNTSGVYTYDYTNEHGCERQDILYLTVNHGTHNIETESVCDSYEWHGETYTESGIYTYDYANANGCASADTLHLIVNSSYTTPISAEICEGDSYNFFGQTLTKAGTYTHTLQSVHGCDSVISLTLTVNDVFNTPITAEICEGGSYNFFGQTLTTAGTYTHTLQSVHSCDSVITLTLTVNDVFNTPITADICEGGSYNFFGQNLTTTGTYSHTLQSIHGCDSVISLTLTVNPVFNTPITAEICEGGSYNFFGQQLTTAGTYTHSLQSVHGCDSVISLTLTVNDVFNTPITAEICEGGSYNFFGQTLTKAGTYTHTLQSVHGCDSVISLTLTVNDVFNTPITTEICEGGSYSFFGQQLTTTGTYTHTLQSVNGCDSVISLTLTVNDVINTPVTAEICEGGSYSFFGQTLTKAGTYTHTLQSVHGCDSVITLTLTVNDVFNTPITAEICEGGSYNFFGQTLTTAGTYTHTLQSIHGCDSVISLTLTVNPVFNTPITAEICEGGSYNFFGQTLTTAGTYTHTLQSNHGCDSVISLTLTVNPVFNTPITTEICEGGSYNFFGQTLTKAGTYTHTLQSVHGCDSLISLTLTVNPVFNTPITAEICEGGSYNFFGQTLTKAGTYTHTLQSAHGCDSVITLTLTVNDVFNTPITAEICEGDSYNFFGQTLTTAGTYTHSLQSVHGCDSVISLTLTVNPVFNTPISAEICEGDSYNFFGQNLTTAGTYTHTLQSIHGCDSVISLTLTVNPVFNTPITAEICEGDSYSFFGQQLTTAGTYTHTLQSIHGCDSVISLTLTVNDVFNTPITAEICEGDSYSFFGQQLTTTGTYTHTLQSIHGCDSVISLTLTVNDVFNTPITVEICEGDSYNFFGQTLTTAGTYTHTLQSVNGCDSVISLTLTVNPFFNTPITAEICEGGSYSFFGQQLTTTGTYTHTLQSVNGCDSVISLTLTVNDVINTPVTAEICEGGSYSFFGQTLTKAGTYTHTLQSVHGCDSVISLTLTVNPISNTPITAEICEGGSYNFFGQTLTTAGTYTHTLQTIHGCDSVISLTLTVNDVINTPITAEICEGGSYNFFGQTLTTAGTYTHTLQSVHGCDSVISLTLTVNPISNTPITAEICEGGSYNFFGQILTTAGTYSHTLQSIHGCDSVITLTLTVNDVINTPITAEICEGDSYNFFGQQLTTAGTYTHTLQSIHGCDSVISLTLTVNDVFNTPITTEICEGGSYNFFGQTLTTAGTYSHTLQSVHGCDSVISLTLTVNPISNTPITAEICEGDSYNFFGQQITTAGTYTHTLQSIHSCDSVISLTLTVNPVFNTPITAEICEGGSYNFFGQQLTTAGTYSHTLQSVHGCDSVISLTLTVNPISNTPITAEICEGDSYSFFGQQLSTAGTYTHTLQTIHGCDSVISLTLTVNDVINTPVTAEICEGGSYNFFGQTLTTAGTYFHTLQSVHGCDSVISLTLTVNPISNTPITAEICEGGSYNFFGQTLTTAGTYTHTLQSIHGCDSVISLTLTVNPVFNTPITAEICEGGSYNFFGQTLTTAGTYTHTLQSVHGCDSVISLTLTVNPISNTPITAEICEGDSYSFFGQQLSTAGTYTHTLQSVHGCDSVISLTLTVNDVFNTPITAEICEGGSYNFFGQQLTTAGTYFHTLQSVHGCDSVISLTLTVNPVFNTPITAEICEGGSYNFFGQQITTAGTYSHTLQSVHGCDSVISLTLTVNDVFNTPITTEICEGGSYNFFGQTLTTAGTYTHTLQSVHGCDSVISLTLTVNPISNTPITAEICEGGSYNFFGQTLTTAGTYTHTLQSVHGCDSVISLTLTVNDVFNTPITTEICEGGSYNFFGQTLTTAGTYSHTLQSVHGCDSVISLTLTVNPVFNTPISAEICEGGSYNFFGQTLTTAGTYTHTLQSIHGCDSVITLTLTVSPVFNTPITAEICEGGSYNFFGQTLTTAGTYTHTLQSVHGCDSVISLTLTVNDVINTPVTAEICEGGSYNFFGQTLTTAGTYTHTLQTIHGCDSVISLTLTVNPVFNTPITAEICEGGSYNFFGQQLTTAGTYSHTLQSVHGCDSVVTLHLTINPSFDITVYDTAVRLHEYTLGDFQITPEETGTFTYDLAGTTAAGCDSTVHLILTVLNNDGIPVIETANVEIFPNPAHTLLNIKGENMRKILIYNTDGQTVYFTDENINDLHQVDVSQYAPGQYFVKIISNNKQSVTKKVVFYRK